MWGKMKLRKISMKRPLRKAFEDGIKKSFELSILAVVMGLSLDKMLLTLWAVLGGSLYCEGNKAFVA